jgi:hypothetical protein
MGPDYKNGAKPEWMVPPPIPNYVINGLGEIYQRDFANVASIHEISRGQVPPGVSSGVAINYLQEQDDTIIGDVVRQYERSLEIVGNMMLAIASQNYLENRKLQIVGDSGQADEFEYKVARKDEKDQVIEKGTIPEGARLVVEAGSSLPRTQTAKQAFILDLYKIGVLGPKGDKATNKRAIKLLEMGNIDEMYEEEAADRAQSEVENEGMKNGTEFMVYPYQDHEVHLQSHEALMKSPEFMSVGESVKMLFDAHRKAHQDLIAPPAPMPGEPPA